MRVRLVSVAVVSLAVSLCVCGCRSTPQESGSSLFPDNLSGDAYRTYTAYVGAVNAGTEKWSAEIPPAYWADRVKALNPIKVYTHRANIVVVQDNADGMEKGKYIYIPVSSYLPQSSDDGFELTPNPRTGNTYNLGNGVFDFKRNK